MDGRTKVYGVIGDPVEHSMSPLMHNFYARRTGKDLVYVPFHVNRGTVEMAVKGAFALNIQGINVTVPHKQYVMKCLEAIDEDALAIGAVNTLVRTEHGYKGYNTDGAGLKRVMDEAGISITGEKCILLGAGGAAKAAAYILAKSGAAVVYILNRSLEKAAALADYINGLAGREVLIPLKLEEYGQIPQNEKGYLAVQSTSVGMHPHTEDVIIEDTDFYKLIHTAVDIVYTPSCTKFMKMVQEAGGKAINGLDMLLYQGLIAYELWNPDVKVDKDTIDTVREMILDHLHGNTRKNNVIFTGFMGAGKTSAGRFYASHYHMPFIDTDQEIEKEAGMAISRIFADKGEEAFRKLETQCLEKLLKTTDGAVISVGGGLPLREENRELLKKLGLVVYLDVSPETVYKRIGADVSSRPMLHSDDVPARIRSLLDERQPLYLKAAHMAVDVNDRSLEEIAEEIYQEAHK